MKLKAEGILRKMRSRLDPIVAYEMSLSREYVQINEMIGKGLKLEFSGEIFCVNCGRKTNKSFNQGYCFPCFKKLQDFFTCLIHPEKCRCDEGDCFQDHIVYLANSSGLKVGITRSTQVPTRWVDQGAVQAIPIARVRTRLQSGMLEVMFKQHVADKTNWREMLKRDPVELDMQAEAKALLSVCKEELIELENQLGKHAISLINGVRSTQIKYPIDEYPAKISSFNFDKNNVVEGTLAGIKGQYLILDSGVINLRKFSGYEVSLYVD
ncbi:MAG: DUF2797 domain-containing protein [Gammaproteobacteria bacterium]|nr:DUF2797 domain-containing protein [Gammaproteobacteria bacterium]MDG1952434.1 DUF2797 domain-containing protein [Gammaproteobacteria bacterium]MDG2119249.1 DUF2797 domain-containing protein [Gammaproteobacteria bacterium]